MSSLESQFGNPKGVLGQVVGILMAVTNRGRNAWTIELLNIQPCDRILEVGFGSGVTIQLLSRIAVDGFIAGIDRSETMVQQASYRNASAIRQGQVELKHGSVAHLPYGNESFDKAFASNSHFFWSEPIECLKELRRVLKPDGLIALSWQPLWAKTEAMVKESADQAVQQLTAAGFRQVRLESKLMKPVIGICALGVK